MAKKKPVKRKQTNTHFRELWKKSKARQSGNMLKSSLWDLEKHGISYSMISKFFECRERFRLANVEGWTETALSIPLEFGNVFHEALEASARSKSWQAAIQRYYKKHSANMAPTEKEELSLICGMVIEVFPRYMDFWNNDSDKSYIYQEKEFAVYRTIPSGRKIKLVGRMDAAYNDSAGRLWLQENKTKGQIDQSLIQSTLNVDLQTLIYSYALQQMHGAPPYGVLYNVIRRPQLRRKVHEKLSDFLERTGTDIAARPDHYYMRWNHELDPQHLEAFLNRMLDPILEQIYDWWESIKQNPFDPWVRADGGRNLLHWQRPFGVYDPLGTKGYGSFFTLLTQGTYRGLEQRDRVFNELDDANLGGS